MWKNDFYPTPSTLAYKVFEHYGKDFFLDSTIMMLEPNAGKGDFADSLLKYVSTSAYIRRADDLKEKIHCVEIEPELQGILNSKGYTIVGSDFLRFSSDVKYNFIFMNPPFSDGYKHLLHAWDILDNGGNIACILPTDYHKKHRNIDHIVNENCEIAHMGQCFLSDDTFIKTPVDVSVYFFRKPAKSSPMFSFEMDDTDDDVDFTGAEHLNSEIALQDKIGNYVTAYNKISEIFVKFAELSSEYAHYIKFFGWNMSNDDFFTKSLVKIGNSCGDPDIQRSAHNEFIMNLKKAAWNVIFDKTKISGFVTQKVHDDFIKFCETQRNLSFSKENIESLIENLYMSRNDIKSQCILEVFEMLTEFHYKNKVHFEGWKTNSLYKVNKKVIIPYGLSSDNWFDRPHVNYHNSRKLDDIDKCMCFLTGKKFDNILTIHNAIHNDGYFGDAFESEFFNIRCFKKGTIHLVFKDLDLLARFNQQAVKDKWNWIGDE